MIPSISSMVDVHLEPSLCGEIRKLGEELTEEEKTLQLFFDLSLDLFCITDLEGHFRRINASWTKELGWSEEELLGTSFLSFAHPDDVDETKRIIAKVKDRNIIRFHNRYRKKGTNEFIVLEWNATWTNGLIYATARPVPERCLICPESKERFGIE